MYVRLDDIEQRHVLAGRGCGARLLAGDPAAAFAGNFTQRDKMREVRERHRTVPGPARLGPQSHVVPPRRAGRYRLRRSPGRDLDDAGRLQRASCATRSPRLPGIVDVDTTLRLDKPDLLVAHRPRAGGGAGRRRAGDRRDAAGGRRRRRPRLALSRRARSTTPTTSSCGWSASTAATAQSISQLYVRAQPSAGARPAMPRDVRTRRSTATVALTRHRQRRAVSTRP